MIKQLIDENSKIAFVSGLNVHFSSPVSICAPHLHATIHTPCHLLICASVFSIITSLMQQSFPSCVHVGLQDLEISA